MELRAKGNMPSFKRKRDNYAQKLRKKKLINYLRSELLTCTTHGLPYIVKADIHWIERLFWAINFFLCLNITIALLSMQYIRFMNTPIVASVEMDYFNWNVSYPAITLCPMYKVEDEDLSDLVNETMESTGENIDGNLRVITTLSYDTIDIVDFANLEDSNVLLSKDFSILAAMMFKKFENDSLTTSTNWPISVEVAMTEMGLCHVINSNVAALDNPTKRTTARYTKNNINLSVHERNFFIQIINYADVYKVYIHSPNELIQSTSPTYTSKSNNYIEFGVRVWSTKISKKLKSAPISIRKCRFVDEPTGERYPVYTYSHCIIECKIRMILKLCECLPHLYKNLPDERVCNLTELPCYVQHKMEITTLSVSNETLKNFTDAKDLPKSPRDCGCVNNCENDDYMKDHESFTPQENNNIVRVGISSYPKVRIVRDTIINLHDIILRSGGVMNLCIGTSVISLMEIVVLIIKILAFYVVNLMRTINLHCRRLIHCIYPSKPQNFIKKQY